MDVTAAMQAPYPKRVHDADDDPDAPNAKRGREGSDDQEPENQKPEVLAKAAIAEALPLTCRFTHRLFTDPVVIEHDGVVHSATHERTVLQGHLDLLTSHGYPLVCPVTGQGLNGDVRLVAAPEVASSSAAFVEKYRDREMKDPAWRKVLVLCQQYTTKNGVPEYVPRSEDDP